MCACYHDTGAVAAPNDEDVTAIDVRAHTMPLHLLPWREQRGLADLARVDTGVVVLDLPVASQPRLYSVRPGR